MKFIVSTGSLLKQLQMIQGVISTSTVLPILEDFLFEIKPGELTISGTDLETSMSTKIKIEAKDKGKIAIPGKILVETLKTLPEQPITFSVNEKTYAIEITSENGKYKLSGENGDDYPRIPIAENVQEVTIPAAVLGKAIAKTIFAVSTDELRPAMTGVYFQLDKDGITFVATDAHKLVRYKRTDTTTNNPSTFIVPKKALNLLKSSLPGDDTSVNISYNNSNAFFTFGDVNLTCRLIDARYPDYNAVIPVDNNKRLTIGRDEFQNSLKRISIFSNKTTHQVVLKISGSDLNVSAQDLDFSNEASERLNCTYEGDDLEIGFNAKFLVEMLGVMDGDEIRLEMASSTRAGILLPLVQEENEEVLMLVMPVMLNT